MGTQSAVNSQWGSERRGIITANWQLRNSGNQEVRKGWNALLPRTGCYTDGVAAQTKG